MMDEGEDESDENNFPPTPVRGNDDQNDEDHNNPTEQISQKKVCNVSFKSR
jgi:hypothetical protein